MVEGRSKLLRYIPSFDGISEVYCVSLRRMQNFEKIVLYSNFLKTGFFGTMRHVSQICFHRSLSLTRNKTFCEHRSFLGFLALCDLPYTFCGEKIRKKGKSLKVQKFLFSPFCFLRAFRLSKTHSPILRITSDSSLVLWGSFLSNNKSAKEILLFRHSSRSAKRCPSLFLKFLT